jgi:hypothetical protein
VTTTRAGGGSATAPVAPGRLGVPLEPAAALAYLTALGRWRDARRHELDELDRAALESPDPGAVTADVALALALWKAVSDRYESLLRTWDSGRIGGAERERLSALIWGRLDATLDPGLLRQTGAGSGSESSGLTVSLPEACRLSDALAVQLRARLSLTGSPAEVGERIRQLRAQLERIREQASLEPAGARQQEASARAAALARRLKDLSDKAARGGDVGGQLEPLEIDATRCERDLIVEAAQLREAGGRVRQARTLRAELDGRQQALRALASRSVAAVSPAPRYAVPDVSALGAVPNTAAALDPYLARLQQVSRALTVASEAYSAALAERDELTGRLDALRAKAGALGVAEHADVARAHALAADLLGRAPTVMIAARPAVELYQTIVTVTAEALGRAGPRSEST